MQGLLSINVPNTVECVPLDELIERATRVDKVIRQTSSGPEAVSAQLFFQKHSPEERDWTIEVVFDSSVNYLIRRAIYSADDGHYRRQQQVVQYKEVTPGLFFPEHVVGTSENNSVQESSLMADFSEIDVNTPLPPGVFQLRYPHGVYLTDAIRGYEYQVDAEGKQISKGKALAQGTQSPISEEERIVSAQEAKEEPQSNLRLILPVSLVLLLIGCSLLIRRGWRNRRR